MFLLNELNRALEAVNESDRLMIAKLNRVSELIFFLAFFGFWLETFGCLKNNKRLISCLIGDCPAESGERIYLIVSIY